jgi:MarR family transcriptional regulator, organic hydroperoxide resistance regulator
MASSSDLTKTIRQLMDVITTRSMRERSHYVKTTGLSLAQFGILMHLYYRKSSGVSHLSEYLNVTTAAASQMVDHLVQAGLVERTESLNDRRAKLLTLTRKGRAMIETGLATRHIWLDAVVERLTPEECRRVEEGLDILARNLQQIQEEK